MEIALLLPLITAMFCGTFQYGMLIYSYNMMINAARNGARSLAVGTSTEAQVTTAVKAALPGYVPAAQVTVTPQSAATTGTGMVTTRITLPSRYATFFSMGPMPATLDVIVTMRNQT